MPCRLRCARLRDGFSALFCGRIRTVRWPKAGGRERSLFLVAHNHVERPEAGGGAAHKREPQSQRVVHGRKEIEQHPESAKDEDSRKDEHEFGEQDVFCLLNHGQWVTRAVLMEQH